MMNLSALGKTKEKAKSMFETMVSRVHSRYVALPFILNNEYVGMPHTERSGCLSEKMLDLELSYSRKTSCVCVLVFTWPPS